MDKLQIVGTIKKLVSEGEIEQALEQLVNALEPEETYEELCHAAIQAQSLFQRTKKDEALGIISFDNAKLNYNQVTYQILNIVDHLEDGKTSLAPAPSVAPKRTWLYVGAGVLVFLLVGFFALRNINGKPDTIQNLADCPAFEAQSPFNVLLFRYAVLGGSSIKATAHEAIRRRLGNLREEHQLKMDIEVYNDQGNDQILPADTKDAAALAESCRAKLVIFGTEEAQPNGNTIITTQYKFLELGEQFQFTKLRINERTQVDTVTSISSITTSGTVTGNIEQQLLQLLLGIVAYETNQIEKAIGILQTAEPIDSGTFMLRNMVLADAYIKGGQPDAALNTYDQVLTEHPRYNFALENRAALLYQQGDYLAAIQDYNTRLENNPNDIPTLTQRGVAHLKAENLEEARQDLEKVQRENPEDSLVRQQLKIVRERFEEKQEMKEEADRKLRINPRDTKALTNKADAAKSIGNYEESIKAAEQLIKQNPSGVPGYATLIKIYTALNQPEKVEEVKKRMLRSGITKSKAIREAPQVRELIRRDSLVVPQNQ